MTRKYKEIIFFTFTICLLFISPIGIFGIEDLKSGELVLNIHDTYFVISVAHFFYFFTPIFFTILYLIKNSIIKFRSLISNLILIIFNGFLVLVLLLLAIGNQENQFQLNYKYWILIFIFVIIEILVIRKSLKLMKARV